MATKTKLKTFLIERRYDFWGEKKIQAATFEDAVQIGMALSWTEFLAAADDDVSIHDVSEISGFAVKEAWE